jgi:ligand-binding sensor domain-containing protein
MARIGCHSNLFLHAISFFSKSFKVLLLKTFLKSARMKFTGAFFISAIRVCAFLPFIGYAQDIHFEPVQGFSDEVGFTVIGMAQDINGYLWIATQGNGLFKYDGDQYTNYRNKPADSNSISSNVVECIATDRDGYIWLGYYHHSSGLDRLDPATGICTHFHHHANDTFSLASDTLNAIMQDHEGTIWLGTVRGLDKYDSKTNRFYHYRHMENDPASLSSNQVRIIYEDKKGTIWVGTGNCWVNENPRKEGGLNKLNKITGKFTRYLHKENEPNSLVDNRVGAILEDRKGIFWVGTAGDGLHTMDREKGTFIRHTYDPNNPSGLSRPPIQHFNYAGAEDHISFLTEDNMGRLWIGTYQGGINVYDPATNTSSYYGPGKNSKEKLTRTYIGLLAKPKRVLSGLAPFLTHVFTK